MLSFLVDRVTEVLIVSGWSAHGSSARPGFNIERLSVIVDLALRINTAIGEVITSVDIYPLEFRAGVKFDQETMDDTYADGGQGQGHDIVANTDFVAGTTDLGLRRTSREPGTGIPRGNVLLKPKVILRSAVQEEFFR
jgi:hypothetical protein